MHVECPLVSAVLRSAVVGLPVGCPFASAELRSTDVCLGVGACRDRRCEPTWVGGWRRGSGFEVPLARILRLELDPCQRLRVPSGPLPRLVRSAVCGPAVIPQVGRQIVETGCVLVIPRAGRQETLPWASGGSLVAVLIAAPLALPTRLLCRRR